MTAHSEPVRLPATWRSGGRLAAIGAAAIAAATIGGVVISLLVWIARGMVDMPVSFGRTPIGVLGLVLSPMFYAAVGGVLAARMPRNAIGWLFLAMGASLGIMLPVNLLVAIAHESLRPATDGVVWAAWARTAFGTPVVLSVAVIAIQLFPDGRLLGGRWRVGAGVGVAGGVLLVATTAMDPSGLISYPSIPNPLALPYAMRDAVDWLRIAGVASILAAAGAAVASLVRRYRRGDAVMRAQLRWIVLAVMVEIAAAVPFVIARYVLRVADATGEMLSAIAQIGSCALPLAAAFAISRYRLFDVDAVIGRTLVYLPMMAVLGGMYTAGIALFQRVFVAVTGSESDVAIVLTILVVSSVFTPLRRTLEGVVDRRFAATPTTKRPRLVEPPRAVAPLSARSGIERVHLAPVAENGSVRCPLGRDTSLQDCLRCSGLRGIADETQLTVVCGLPSGEAADLASGPGR